MDDAKQCQVLRESIVTLMNTHRPKPAIGIQVLTEALASAIAMHVPAAELTHALNLTANRLHELAQVVAELDRQFTAERNKLS